MKRVGFTESVDYSCLEDLRSTNPFRRLAMLCLDYCGIEECKAGYAFGPYVREDYVIHFVFAGRGKYRVENREEMSMPTGSMFLNSPGVRTWYQADVADPWSYAWVGFNGYRAQEFVHKIGFSEKKLALPAPEIEEILGCIRRMLDARALTDVNEMIRISELYKLFGILMRGRPDRRDTQQSDYASQQYVHCAVNYMSANYPNRLQIDDIANTLGISRGYLTSCFKKHMCLSPQEFLIRLRMEKAAYLLSHTTDPIGQISDQVGYSDQLSFSKAFKQHYQMSPKAYRESDVHLEIVSHKGDYIGDEPL